MTEHDKFAVVEDMPCDDMMGRFLRSKKSGLRFSSRLLEAGVDTSHLISNRPTLQSYRRTTSSSDFGNTRVSSQTIFAGSIPMLPKCIRWKQAQPIIFNFCDYLYSHLISVRLLHTSIVVSHVSNSSCHFHLADLYRQYKVRS